jgi:hypothetical protein
MKFHDIYIKYTWKNKKYYFINHFVLSTKEKIISLTILFNKQKNCFINQFVYYGTKQNTMKMCSVDSRNYAEGGFLIFKKRKKIPTEEKK